MSEWMDRLVRQMTEQDPRKRGVITGFKETLKIPNEHYEPPLVFWC